MYNPDDDITLTMVDPSSKPNKPGLKRWIILLLAVSCFTTVLLYISYTPPEHRQLWSTAQVDSLVVTMLDEALIPVSQVRRRVVTIDADLSRIVYTVDLPPGFSKTEWHYKLDKKMRAYGVQTPARVQFPGQDFHIHLTYGSTVIRSIILRTNPDLPLYRSIEEP